MTAERWRIVGGRVYKLEQAFEDMLEAVRLARNLKSKHHVFLHRTESGLWAVYWRRREQEIECQPNTTPVSQDPTVPNA